MSTQHEDSSPVYSTRKEMTCPHCKISNAIFQSLEPLTVIPTIEKWKFDELSNQLQHSLVYICIECECRVKIDIRKRFITPLQSDPIFDEVTKRILELCLTPEKRKADVPAKVIKALKDRLFKRLHHLLTGEELASLIIEQR